MFRHVRPAANQPPSTTLLRSRPTKDRTSSVWLSPSVVLDDNAEIDIIKIDDSCEFGLIRALGGQEGWLQLNYVQVQVGVALAQHYRTDGVSSTQLRSVPSDERSQAVYVQPNISVQSGEVVEILATNSPNAWKFLHVKVRGVAGWLKTRHIKFSPGSLPERHRARFGGAVRMSSTADEVSSNYKLFTRSAGPWPADAVQKLQHALGKYGDRNLATINLYTQDFVYGPINEALLRDSTDDLQFYGGYIMSLKDALWHVGQRHGFFKGTCCRGLKVSEGTRAEFAQLAATSGAEFLFAGFVSTSRGTKSAFSGNVQLEIDCSKDSVQASAVYVADWSLYPEEEEVLFLPYSGFKVVSGYDDGSTVHIKLESKDRSLIDSSHLTGSFGRGVVCVRCLDSSCEKRQVWGRQMCASGPCRAEYLRLKGEHGDAFARSYVLKL